MSPINLNLNAKFYLKTHLKYFLLYLIYINDIYRKQLKRGICLIKCAANRMRQNVAVVLFKSIKFEVTSSRF